MIKEICKMGIIGILWAFPIITAVIFGSAWFLLLFAVSFIMTVFVLCHYEDLVKAQNNNTININEVKM